MTVPRAKRCRSQGTGRIVRKAFRSLGKNVVFESGARAFHPENISIGSNVYIGHQTILKGYYRNQLMIGDETWIGQNCFLHSAGGIRIGRAVGIGPMVKIISSQHIETPGEGPMLFNQLEFGEVIIEDGCDIGVGAILLPGTRIGKGAVVGAGAVVTKDVPPYWVVAGVPARRLRKRRK